MFMLHDLGSKKKKKKKKNLYMYRIPDLRMQNYAVVHLLLFGSVRSACLRCSFDCILVSSIESIASF